ncbi:hypothetical protein BDF22DRAFT_730598 [Syncephalis plumigaleata]|nr:hypothetical protein BDF22DRAFT_730598 [Syncephalis plumigaleata]
MLRRSFSFPDVAIVLDMDDARNAGCHTLAQMGIEVDALSREFIRAKVPPVKLMIVTVTTNGSTPYWGSNAYGYQTSNPSSVPDGPPVVATALLDQSASQVLYHAAIPAYRRFYFKATEEPGPWNDMFLSSKFIVAQNIAFSLTLVSLLYVCARVYQQIKLRVFSRDLYFIIFIMFVIQSVVLLVYWKTIEVSYCGLIIKEMTVYLSRFTYSVALLYWAIQSKNLIGRIASVLFRLVIVLDIASVNVIFILNMCLINYDEMQRIEMDNNVIWQNIMPSLPISGMIIFNVFGIWFMWYAYQMRIYKNHCTNLLKLVVFIEWTCLVYTACSVRFFMQSFTNYVYNQETINEAAIIEIAEYTALLLRTFGCLATMGLTWPTSRVNDTTGSTLSGSTMVDTTSILSESNYKRDSHRGYSILAPPPKARPSLMVSEVWESSTSDLSSSDSSSNRCSDRTVLSYDN